MDKNICEGILKNTENEMAQVINEGLCCGNVEYLYKLVDIHKDIMNEKYWENKEEIMRYRGYNSYRGGDGNESFGRRYRGNYGRRGVDSRYRGEDYLEDMYEAYQDYSDSSSYGHEEEGDKAYQFMVEKGMEFVDYLDESAKTPKQKEVMRRFKEEIGRR